MFLTGAGQYLLALATPFFRVSCLGVQLKVYLSRSTTRIWLGVAIEH